MGLLDGKVAIVTGGGNGLGEAYCKLFAAEGASVVVNDLGGARDGTGGSLTAAQTVAEAIKAAGGKAVANGDDVSTVQGGQNIFQAAIDNFGRVDILVNNAGILRDKTFANTSEADWDAVIKVHLKGAYCCTMPVWNWMKDNQVKGVIVMTSSGSGLFGNFGQSNYGAAKMGIIGFMNTIKLEGQKNNVHINAISPVAATRMTENIMPAATLELLKPEYVTPGVVYLASEEAPTGCILAAGAGVFALARIYETEGVHLGEAGLSAEAVRDNWAKITDEAGQKAYFQGGEQGAKIFRQLAAG
jgi:NAD(P)-dependent dehydrogenase (short-subunit alcohol dehydrogenase family)